MSHKGSTLSIIDKDVSIEGIVATQGRLIIKGSVKGNLAGGEVTIAEGGIVAAEAKVVSMTIGGVFDGEVQASKELIILSTGNCTGKVTCKDLVIEAGGVLNAAVTCREWEAGEKIDPSSAQIEPSATSPAAS